MGMSPLHHLFWRSGPMNESSLREAARFLVGTGCLIDLRDRTGESPFHVACLRKERVQDIYVYIIATTPSASRGLPVCRPDFF